jgi:TetR/AcrR family hemagglutinin/protease transcriptional regulator
MTSALSEPNANGDAKQRRTRLKPEERKAQLLETALEVFARRGFGRAGHAEIAQAAGVAVSTVFLYFPTRKVLVTSVLDEVGRFYVDLAQRVHAEGGPVVEVFAEHRRQFHATVETHPHRSRIALDWSTAAREDVWPLYLEFIDELVRNHMTTIRRGQMSGEVPATVDPETSALMLIGTAQMTAQLRLAGTESEKLERMSALMIGAALGQLTPTGAPS